MCGARGFLVEAWRLLEREVGGSDFSRRGRSSEWEVGRSDFLLRRGWWARGSRWDLCA
ncbi:hypothetical protein GCM10009639_66660 [Kitasatospora putterlickiae]|uniref:Uncharacterized protein n=1 Tax=Kitasatospora putterlickiae TaxID=221725 RepID=A0ABP4J939_9ACTN